MCLPFNVKNILDLFVFSSFSQPHPTTSFTPNPLPCLALKSLLFLTFPLFK
eukprot:TRINITY_DN27272_c0_g1_i1.p5 TRINITY_DN27272_c0_g1~~TRINITY_DN27272_c0_g1_i1.p5  ORF type:complete len:51 (+),score=7.59 TRINITY_DN27272_c0_g1_i1:380-532(+)